MDSSGWQKTGRVMELTKRYGCVEGYVLHTSWAIIVQTQDDGEACLASGRARSVASAKQAADAWVAAQDWPWRMAGYIEDLTAWSRETFGPGLRTESIVDHIRKELDEVEAAPADPMEWVDIAMMALDGAVRAGASPSEVADMLRSKLAKCKARKWPDWRTAPEGKAIEHVRPVGVNTVEKL